MAQDPIYFLCFFVVLVCSFFMVGVCGFNYPPPSINLTGLTQHQRPAPPPFSVITLHSHQLSNGVIVDCVQLLPNSSASRSSEEALSRFPTAGSGWRKLTKDASVRFEAEIPQRCSMYTGSIAVQRGDIFDDVIRDVVGNRQHIMTPNTNLQNSYAIYSSVSEDVFTGAVAVLSINSPSVQDGDVSISQIWVVANRDNIATYSTLEAGWIVYPAVFGDNNPRLFIYWTTDNYQQQGCFNRICAGFVQTDNTWLLGEPFPSGPSVPGDENQQQYVTIYIFMNPANGVWYLQLDSIVVGYWDPNIVTTFNGNYADELQFGGEVQVQQLGGSSQMGSGYFPRQGFPWAASQWYLRYLHDTLDLNDFGPDELEDFVTHQNFYGLGSLKLDSNRRVQWFFFGGAGN